MKMRAEKREVLCFGYYSCNFLFLLSLWYPWEFQVQVFFPSVRYFTMICHKFSYRDHQKRCDFFIKHFMNYQKNKIKYKIEQNMNNNVFIFMWSIKSSKMSSVNVDSTDSNCE